MHMLSYRAAKAFQNRLFSGPYANEGVGKMRFIQAGKPRRFTTGEGVGAHIEGKSNGPTSFHIYPDVT